MTNDPLPELEPSEDVPRPVIVAPLHYESGRDQIRRGTRLKAGKIIRAVAGGLCVSIAAVSFVSVIPGALILTVSGSFVWVMTVAFYALACAWLIHSTWKYIGQVPFIDAEAVFSVTFRVGGVIVMGALIIACIVFQDDISRIR